MVAVRPLAAAPTSPSRPVMASSNDLRTPSDSSSGVVCAFPTANLPSSSTTKASVMVPPASMANTRASVMYPLLTHVSPLSADVKNPTSSGQRDDSMPTQTRQLYVLVQVILCGLGALAASRPPRAPAAYRLWDGMRCACYLAAGAGGMGEQGAVALGG